jgi:AcrR family transcriptional regulator
VVQLPHVDVEGVRVVSSRGADQRARVLAAAVEAIADVGPERLTVRDIAARAGMSAGHVLYYFGRKDRILVETLRMSEEELGETRREALRRARTARAGIRRFVALYLPTSSEDQRWNLWNQVIARPPQDLADRAAVLALEQAWVDDLTSLIELGVARGEFALRTGTDPAEVAERHRFLLDGVASEILIGLPGRTPAWGGRLVLRSLARDLVLTTP